MEISPFADVSDEEFKKVMIMLYAYVNRKMNHLHGTRLYYIASPKDIAHQAVEKTLSNVRPWNKGNVDLFAHLAGCARSILSNYLKSSEITKCDISKTSYHEIPNKELSPEEINIFIEETDHFIDFVSKHRADLIKLTKAILLEEITKPKDLSLHLDISISKVNTGKVALKRIIDKYHQR